MYGKPRTATVTCVVDGWLWCLERKAFRGILVDRMTHDNTVKILRKVSLLAARRWHNRIHIRRLSIVLCGTFALSPLWNVQSHLIAGFHQVKTLRSLSTLKLQQLSSLMEEESFVDQQDIATHGEELKKFFVIVAGTVSTLPLFGSLVARAGPEHRARARLYLKDA